jgi:hypothetical protein
MITEPTLDKLKGLRLYGMPMLGRHNTMRR